MQPLIRSEAFKKQRCVLQSDTDEEAVLTLSFAKELKNAAQFLPIQVEIERVHL